MNDWFEWNGVRCTDLGIHVEKQPPLTLASERATFTNVPGRPGSLTTLEGDDVYDDMILTANCFVTDIDNYEDIAAYLKGSGKVTFATRPEGFYYARIVNHISFDRILRGNPHRSFAVNFRCKPFWYPESVAAITLTSSTSFVTNPGNVYSEPIITVRGSGEITLMVDTTIVELSDISGSITLNSELKDAYTGVFTANSKMSGEFPVLQPGSNAVSWSGNVSSVEIMPNWRYLG